MVDVLKLIDDAEEHLAIARGTLYDAMSEVKKLRREANSAKIRIVKLEKVPCRKCSRLFDRKDLNYGQLCKTCESEGVGEGNEAVS